jgi:hypothetical protein
MRKLGFRFSHLRPAANVELRETIDGLAPGLLDALPRADTKPRTSTSTWTDA